MMNDADLLTLEYEAAAANAAAGVCIRCDDALDPFHPKWASDFAGRNYGPQDVLDSLGPESTQFPGYHTTCITDLLLEEG